MAAVKLYGITIYIHDDNSKNIYQIEEDSPIPIEEDVEKYKEDTSFKLSYLTKFKTLCTLSVRIPQIESDGNCYFRALSDQISGSDEGHRILRILILDFISDNRELFEPFIDHEYFSSWNDFVFKMRQDGTFADGTIIVASATLLRREIIISSK
ncbi:unnamed protein product [Adineta steineri]|uniref:OTU domain-containing protein n=1 Tax=Adineta steineri TaxID=433720 RepID=A0A819DVL1_9BILA|nr:unnamed protein product [Adineta steineri]CAF3839894.1 unnamed protein product [Adineta steineri]